MSDDLINIDAELNFDSSGDDLDQAQDDILGVAAATSLAGQSAEDASSQIQQLGAAYKGLGQDLAAISSQLTNIHSNIKDPSDYISELDKFNKSPNIPLKKIKDKPLDFFNQFYSDFSKVEKLNGTIPETDNLSRSFQIGLNLAEMRIEKINSNEELEIIEALSKYTEIQERLKSINEKLNKKKGGRKSTSYSNEKIKDYEDINDIENAINDYIDDTITKQEKKQKKRRRKPQGNGQNSPSGNGQNLPQGNSKWDDTLVDFDGNKAAKFSNKNPIGMSINQLFTTLGQIQLTFTELSQMINKIDLLAKSWTKANFESSPLALDEKNARAEMTVRKNLVQEAIGVDFLKQRELDNLHLTNKKVDYLEQGGQELKVAKAIAEVDHLKQNPNSLKNQFELNDKKVEIESAYLGKVMVNPQSLNAFTSQKLGATMAGFESRIKQGSVDAIYNRLSDIEKQNLFDKEQRRKELSLEGKERDNIIKRERMSAYANLSAAEKNNIAQGYWTRQQANTSIIQAREIQAQAVINKGQAFQDEKLEKELEKLNYQTKVKEYEAFKGESIMNALNGDPTLIKAYQEALISGQIGRAETASLNAEAKKIIGADKLAHKMEEEILAKELNNAIKTEKINNLQERNEKKRGEGFKESIISGISRYADGAHGKTGWQGVFVRFGENFFKNSRIGNVFQKKDEYGNIIDKKNPITGASVKTGINLGGIVTLGFAKALQVAGNELRKFGKAAVTAYGELESIQTNLEVVYGSKSEASETFERIKDYATRSPFGVQQTASFATLLKQSGIEEFKLMDTIKMLGDTAGGNQVKYERIANNYAQIVAANKATSMDLRQFANAGLPIYKELRNYLGMTQQEIREQTQKGKISAEIIEQVFKRMTSEGGSFYKAIEKGAETYAAWQQNRKDIWDIAKAEFGSFVFNVGKDLDNDSILKTVVNIYDTLRSGVVTVLPKKMNEGREVKILSQIERRINHLTGMLSDGESRFTDKQIDIINSTINNIGSTYYKDSLKSEYDQIQKKNAPVLSLDSDKFNLLLNWDNNIRSELKYTSADNNLLLGRFLGSSVSTLTGFTSIYNGILDILKLPRVKDYYDWQKADEYNKSYAKLFEGTEIEKYLKVSLGDKILHLLTGGFLGRNSQMLDEKGKKYVGTAVNSFLEEKAIVEQLIHTPLKDLNNGFKELDTYFKDKFGKDLITAVRMTQGGSIYTYLGNTKNAIDEHNYNIKNSTFTKTKEFIKNPKGYDYTSEEVKNNKLAWSKYENQEKILGIDKTGLRWVQTAFDKGFTDQVFKILQERTSQSFIEFNPAKTTDKELRTINENINNLDDVILYFLEQSENLSNSDLNYFKDSLESLKIKTSQSLNGMNFNDRFIFLRDLDNKFRIFFNELSLKGIEYADIINRSLRSEAENELTKIDNNSDNDDKSDDILPFYKRIMSSTLGIDEDIVKNVSGSVGIFDVYKKQALRQQNESIMKAYLSGPKNNLTSALNQIAYQGDSVAGTRSVDQVKTNENLKSLALSLDTSSETTKAYADKLQEQQNQLNDLISAGLFRQEGSDYIFDETKAKALGYEPESIKQLLEDINAFSFDGEKINKPLESFYKLNKELLNTTTALASFKTEIEKNKNEIEKNNLKTSILASGIGGNLPIEVMKSYADTVSSLLGPSFDEKTKQKIISSSIKNVINGGTLKGYTKNASEENLSELVKSGNASPGTLISAATTLLSSIIEADESAKVAISAQGTATIAQGLTAGAEGSLVGNNQTQNRYELVKNAFDPFGFNGYKDYNGNFITRYGNNTRREQIALNRFRDWGDASAENIDMDTYAQRKAKTLIGDENKEARKTYLETMKEKAESLGMNIDELSLDFTSEAAAIDSVKNITEAMGNLGELTATVDQQMLSLGDSMKNTFKESLFNGITQSFVKIGENLRDGESASNGISAAWKNVTSSMLGAVGAAMTNAGLNIAAAAAAERGAGWKATAARGLMLAAAGGISSIASGILGEGGSDDSNKDNGEKEKIQNLKDALSDLIDQAKTDAEYYENNLRHKNALAANEIVSKRSVNDAIISPSGSIITTHPDDYLIATKTPETLIGNRNVAVAPVVNLVINNQIANKAKVVTEERQNEDGSMDIVATIIDVVNEGLATGKLDDGMQAYQYQQQGRTVAN